MQSVRCLGLNQHLIRQKRHTFLVSLSLLYLGLSHFWIAIKFGYINQWREKTQLMQIGNSRKQIWFSSLACSTKIRPPCHQQLASRVPRLDHYFYCSKTWSLLLLFKDLVITFTVLRLDHYFYCSKT